MTVAPAQRSKAAPDMILPGKAPWRSDVLRYAIGIVAVALVVAARLLLAPPASDESLYLFLVPAVMAAAGLGGVGPGLIATALGLLFGILMSVHPQLTAADIVNAAAFAATGAG